jgi:hypothetical protein
MNSLTCQVMRMSQCCAVVPLLRSGFVMWRPAWWDPAPRALPVKWTHLALVGALVGTMALAGCSTPDGSQSDPKLAGGPATDAMLGHPAIDPTVAPAPIVAPAPTVSDPDGLATVDGALVDTAGVAHEPDQTAGETVMSIDIDVVRNGTTIAMRLVERCRAGESQCELITDPVVIDDQMAPGHLSRFQQPRSQLPAVLTALVNTMASGGQPTGAPATWKADVSALQLANVFGGTEAAVVSELAERAVTPMALTVSEIDGRWHVVQLHGVELHGAELGWSLRVTFTAEA